MAVKKTELYSSLWASCDELRGGMDSSQYKDYILTLLFMKYVSDKYKGQKYADITVFNKSDFKLNTKKTEDYIYRCVLGACANNSIYAINEMLKKHKVPLLGSSPEE